MRNGHKKRNVFKFKHWHLHCGSSDKTDPKKILNVDLSLDLSVQNFFIDFKNKNLFQILGETGFYIEGAHLAYLSLTSS